MRPEAIKIGVRGVMVPTATVQEGKPQGGEA